MLDRQDLRAQHYLPTRLLEGGILFGFK